jgi:hypothetical protein
MELQDQEKLKLNGKYQFVVSVGDNLMGGNIHIMNTVSKETVR